MGDETMIKPLIDIVAIGEPYNCGIRQKGGGVMMVPMSDGNIYTIGELSEMTPIDPKTGKHLLSKSCLRNRGKNRLIGWTSPDMFLPPAQKGRQVTGICNGAQKNIKKDIAIKDCDNLSHLSGRVRSENLLKISTGTLEIKIWK
jgi:hypothetical protein